MVTITHTVDHGDGSYTSTFSEPVVVTSIADFDQQVLTWDPTNGTWNAIQWQTQVNPTTVTWEDTVGDSGNLYIVFLGAPQNLTAAHPFAVAGPQSIIG